MERKSNRIVILGGGFAGIYTAMHLERLLRRHDDFEILLINKENYFAFQPVLAEVVSGSIGVLESETSANVVTSVAAISNTRLAANVSMPGRLLVLSQRQPTPDSYHF